MRDKLELESKLVLTLFSDLEATEIEKSKLGNKADLLVRNVELLENEIKNIKKEEKLAIGILREENSDLIGLLREAINREAILDLKLKAYKLQGDQNSLSKRVIKSFFYSRSRTKEVSTALKVAESGFFDVYWYLKKYKDVASSHINPIVHFLRHGRDDGRNPSQKFDSRWYEKTYLKNDDNSINPLVHFIEYGKDAGYEIKSCK